MSGFGIVAAGAACGYLPEEDATVLAEVQGVAVLLPHWVVLLQREVHELPVHLVAGGEDQVVAELHAIDINAFFFTVFVV